MMINLIPVLVLSLLGAVLGYLFTALSVWSESFVGFEKVLTHKSLGITPKEAYKKYGKKVGKHPVGSGPFALESFTDSKIVLKRNPEYWRKDDLGNRLPFMANVVMTYAKDHRAALLAFRKSQIDLVLELPVEEIEHVLGTLLEAQEGKNVKHKVDSEMSMSMSYVAMANESEEFKDPRVRKAFNLAIDRNEIINIDLEGEGWPATKGFLPKMKDYPNENIRGHKFNVAKAKSLMREAGYPNGNNFPKLDFYVNSPEGSSVHKTCKAVSAQLKENLNIDLNIVLVSTEERETAINSGKAKIWRAGWIADYPDPENFLNLFDGKWFEPDLSVKTYINSFRYKSDNYDELFHAALATTDAGYFGRGIYFSSNGD